MTPIPHSLTSALADRYRIERELGQGGMATVYCAHDIKHDRQVALKVLRPELAAVIGAERFLAEIKTTANLQHPHILPLFDSGQVHGTVFYVMPLVTGESLRDRLNREKQLPVVEAVRIATEVASALDYAHRHGVIHRDIKPENILLHDGSALVADFGIALAASRSEGSTRMTETGMSLGTPHYMSPEQALGERNLDARADIYALGCMLYEMLAGETPFDGPTAQAIVAKVMTAEATALTTLRRTVPRHVARAVHRSLQKLPADRFESASKFAEMLNDPRAADASTDDVAGIPLRANRPALMFAALAVVLLAVVMWTGFRPRASSSADVNTFALSLPDAQAIAATAGTQVAFSPDGRSFVYSGPGSGPGSAPGRSQLWMRRLGEIEAVPVAGSDGATSPEFSPDGTEIGFVTLTPFAAKVVSVTGGKARTLVSDGISGGGLTWGSDGYIYFDGGYTGLSRIRPDGTGASAVMPLDTSKQEAVAWPTALPDGRGILARVREGGEAGSDYSIVVVNPKDGSRKHLLNGLVARYSRTGHLVWVSADGALNAQRFDLRHLELKGSPVVLATGIGLGAFGAAGFALSPTGDLIYLTGSRDNTQLEMLWLTRDGTAARVDSTGERGLIDDFSLSYDGKSVAMEKRPRIWVKTLGGPTHVVTGELNISRNPIWSPDNQDILYSATGGEAVYRRRADGSGSEQLVVRERRGVDALAISPDGRTLLLTCGDPMGLGDVMQFRIGVDTVATALIATPSNERNATFSPDGRWIAYESDESGIFEIYVAPFPDVNAKKIQVSVSGGSAPHWNANGGQLFFISRDNELTAAQVRTAPLFAVDRLTRLFDVSRFPVRKFDVSPDGSRFLMLSLTGTQAPTSNGRLILVQNFAAELNRRLPK